MKVQSESLMNMNKTILSEIFTPQKKWKSALRWFLTGLPLVGVVIVSLLPLQDWMRQTLVLVVLIWFHVFFLFDTFFLLEKTHPEMKGKK
jgi:hypothetical protein